MRHTCINNNSGKFNLLSAGVTAQVPIIKLTQRHKKDTQKTVQIPQPKTLNKENKYNIVGKAVKKNTKLEALNPLGKHR